MDDVNLCSKIKTLICFPFNCLYYKNPFEMKQYNIKDKAMEFSYISLMLLLFFLLQTSAVPTKKASIFLYLFRFQLGFVFYSCLYMRVYIYIFFSFVVLHCLFGITLLWIEPYYTWCPTRNRIPLRYFRISHGEVQCFLRKFHLTLISNLIFLCIV